MKTIDNNNPLSKIESELENGMRLSKCRKCGCMNDTLKNVGISLKTSETKGSSDLVKKIEQWLDQMEAIKYSCLGCRYCFPAEAMNTFNEALLSRKTIKTKSSFDRLYNINGGKMWFPILGEFSASCKGPICPVAVSTLASVKLAENLAKNRPKELCIVGKTETENIGIEKVIKNVTSNSTIKFLILAGKDSVGHYSGNTLLALWKNGVDTNMKVIGSRGKLPVLRNMTMEEVNRFRKQIKIIDMIGNEDVESIIKSIKEQDISKNISDICGCSDTEYFCDEVAKSSSLPAPVTIIHPKESHKVEMDKAGYFVIISQPKNKIIVVEQYSYDNKLLRVIEGEDARSIYCTIIDNGWITQLSHAVYIGKELEKAELSIKLGFKFIQDKA